MQSMFDERLWLAWLVKVRIIILTFLLGIELAISRLTPTHCRCGFSSTPSCCGTRFLFFILLLLSFWQEYRVQSVLQVLTDWFWFRWLFTPLVEKTARSIFFTPW